MQNRPAHEIRLGAIRAAIWENKNRTHETWFSVTISRFYRVGDQWKDINSLGRDDLPIAAKIMEMAYEWIWSQQGTSAHSDSSPQSNSGTMSHSSQVNQYPASEHRKT